MRSAWPDPPFPAQGNLEWATNGPYQSMWTCNQTADGHYGNINTSNCFTGPDGGVYFYMLRQAAR